MNHVFWNIVAMVIMKLMINVYPFVKMNVFMENVFNQMFAIVNQVGAVKLVIKTVRIVIMDQIVRMNVDVKMAPFVIRSMVIVHVHRVGQV